MDGQFWSAGHAKTHPQNISLFSKPPLDGQYSRWILCNLRHPDLFCLGVVRRTVTLCHQLTVGRWIIELKLSDRLVDLTDERIDLAVRIGQAADSTAAFRKLADNRRGLFAAPAYLAKFGCPVTPDELSGHLCLRYGDGNEPWELQGPAARKFQFSPRTRLHSDNGDVVHDWAIGGQGIVLQSTIDVVGELDSGRLQRVLPDWQTASLPIYALYPSSRHLPAKTCIFLESIALKLQPLGG